MKIIGGASISFRADFPAMQGFINALATNTRNNAIAAMQAPKTGLVYYKAGQGKSNSRSRRGRSRRNRDKHIASAPGEAPAVDNGKLINNTEADLASGGSLTAVVGVRKEIKYAPALEFGTAKMRPRPFLRPAADKAMKEVKMTDAPVQVIIGR